MTLLLFIWRTALLASDAKLPYLYTLSWVKPRAASAALRSAKTRSVSGSSCMKTPILTGAEPGAPVMVFHPLK